MCSSDLAGWEMFMCRPLRPYICFLLLDNTTRFRLMTCWICDPFVVFFFVIFSRYELLYVLCRRVMQCASLFHKSRSLFYIDGCANYIASLYNSGVGVLQGLHRNINPASLFQRPKLPPGNPELFVDVHEETT